MGDYGRNGRLKNITVRSGEGWTALAKRLGLNERQYEDLMRENSNITQLKAGQTVRMGNLRRNNDAYVSNHGAMAAGMASNEQVRQLYAANGTGGFGSDRLRSPNAPIYGGNFGYNTTTKAGRSQMAWQNNPNNPSGIAAAAPKPGQQPGVNPAAQVNANGPANLAPMAGNQKAQEWQAQQAQEWQAQQAQQAQLTRQQYALDQSARSAAAIQNATIPNVTAGASVTRPLVTIGPPTNRSATIGPPQTPMSVAAGASVARSPFGPSAPTNAAQPTTPTGTVQGPPAPDVALAQFNAEKARFEAEQIDATFSSGNPALFPATITTSQLGGLQSMYANHTQAEITGRLAQLGYIQDVSGSFVRPGDTTGSGGPNLVPSGYGDYAGLPAYEGPPAGYIDYNEAYGRRGGGSGGGKKSTQPFQRTYQRDGTWRIGG